MSSPNDFPAVATIIGCPEQLTSANGLVATPLAISGDFPTPNLPEDTSHVSDPVQRAVLDNICGKLPTKNPVEGLKCDVCNIECNGDVSYQVHLQGSKHHKKLKEQKMQSFAKLPFITENKETKTFQCTYCNMTLNAISQIEAHIEGARHIKKSKNAPPEHLVAQTNINRETSDECPVENCPTNDPMELYCGICNIHANSKLQLAQHTVSQRHLAKQKSYKPPRFEPYQMNNKRNNQNAMDNSNAIKNKTMSYYTRRPWARETNSQNMQSTPCRRGTCRPAFNSNNIGW